MSQIMISIEDAQQVVDEFYDIVYRILHVAYQDAAVNINTNDLPQFIEQKALEIMVQLTEDFKNNSGACH